MEVSLQLIKEFFQSHKDWFYAFGSLAGVIAFFRPLVESKLQRDQDRARGIIEHLPEQLVINLESDIYQSRQVAWESFQPFDQIQHKLDTCQDAVRFSGPTRKLLLSALADMLKSYKELRKLVQVPMWEVDSTEEGRERAYRWRFNKYAFLGSEGFPIDYEKHLNECAEHAVAIRRAQQRFQIAAEIQLLELPLARLLVWLRSPRMPKKST